MSKDLKFLLHIPQVIRIGIFNVSLEKVKELLLNNCKFLLEQVKSTIINKFVSLVQTTETKVSETIFKLETVPNTIDEFLEIKEFIKGANLENTITEIKENLQKISEVIIIIEDNCIEYESEVYQVAFIGKSIWLNKLEEKIIESQKMLENSRMKFFKILEKQKLEILEIFETVKNDIESFKYYYDITECFRYNANAKNIMLKLTNLLESIKQMNKYEEVLQYNVSDLKIVSEAYADFEKYYLLWEFIAEKWKYVFYQLKFYLFFYFFHF